MIPYLRRKVMLSLLSEKEVVYINEFKEALPDISESTIKRELVSMEKEGLIIKLKGGAAKLTPDNSRKSFDMPMDLKLQLNIQGKEKIAEYAASLVHSGEVIFLDTSSTVAPMVKYLKNKDVKIVTSSIRLPALTKNDRLSFYIVGGDYNASTESVLGSSTNELLSTMYFDQAFLGANGFSEKSGITTPDVRESTKKRIILKNSKITYFLLDSTKAGITTFNEVIALAESNIITDEKNTLLKLCKSSKVV